MQSSCEGEGSSLGAMQLLISVVGLLSTCFNTFSADGHSKRKQVLGQVDVISQHGAWGQHRAVYCADISVIQAPSLHAAWGSVFILAHAASLRFPVTHARDTLLGELFASSNHFDLTKPSRTAFIH